MKLKERFHFSKDIFKAISQFGLSTWATRFSTECFGGLEHCPRLLQVYNIVPGEDIEYTPYGPRPEKARMFMEGIAYHPGFGIKDKPYTLGKITIALSIMDGKFDDVDSKKKEIEAAAIERCTECAKEFGIPLVISDKIRFDYYRHDWDPKKYEVTIK